MSSKSFEVSIRGFRSFFSPFRPLDCLDILILDYLAFWVLPSFEQVDFADPERFTSKILTNLAFGATLSLGCGIEAIWSVRDDPRLLPILAYQFVVGFASHTLSLISMVTLNNRFGINPLQSWLYNFFLMASAIGFLIFAFWSFRKWHQRCRAHPEGGWHL